MIQKILTVYLLLTGAVVAFYRIAPPVYYEGLIGPIGDVVHWLMAVGVALMLLVSVLWWYNSRQADSTDMGTGVAFYGSIALTIMFFWVWLCSMTIEGEIADIIHGVWWPPVDTMYIVLAIGVGQRLWRRS